MDQPFEASATAPGGVRWLEQIEGLLAQVDDLVRRHRGQLVALTVLAPSAFLDSGLGEAVVRRLGDALPGVAEVSLRLGGTTLRVFEAEFAPPQSSRAHEGGS